MMRRVTMLKVANRAGVHVTTVSLALRNHPSLPLSTRQRLQSLAKKMGYRPDPALSSLVAYRNSLRPMKNRLTLAYITDWQSRWGWKKRPAHAQFFAGAAAKAQLLGYKLEHFWQAEAGLTHKRLSEMLHARGITGVIVASHHRLARDSLDLDWEKFSGVKIDFFPHQPALHSVSNDQRGIIQLATRRVVAAGYRRIGVVMPTWWDQVVDLAWSSGFLAEQQQFTLGERIPILSYADPAAEYLVPAAPFEKWYRRHRPEVILSYAPFVRPRLEQAGLAVPEAVSYVDLLLERFDGTTAGIRHNCNCVGQLAVEILAGQLQLHSRGIPEFATTTLVGGTWFDGKSLPPHPRRNIRPPPTVLV